MKPNTETAHVVDVLDRPRPQSLRLIPGNPGNDESNDPFVTLDSSLSDDYENGDDQDIVFFKAEYERRKTKTTSWYSKNDPHIDYVARTQEPEIGSERTTFFETELEKVAKGTRMEGRVNVVILNKGEDPTAYIRDDVIFISQSMINILGRVGLDPIIAVLDHELRHGINNTSLKRTQGSEATARGVEWFHEGASDAVLKDLEKLGYRSDALSKGFGELRKYFNAKEAGSGNRRDFAHQTFLARMSQDELLHDIIDTETSNQPFKELPQIYKRAVKPTNLEILTNLKFTDADQEVATACYRKLHEEDMVNIFELNRKNAYLMIPLIRERLSSKFTKTEVDIFVISLFNRGVTFDNFAHAKDLITQALQGNEKTQKAFFGRKAFKLANHEVQRRTIEYFLGGRMKVQEASEREYVHPEDIVDLIAIASKNEEIRVSKLQDNERDYYDESGELIISQKVLEGYLIHFLNLSSEQLSPQLLSDLRQVIQQLNSKHILTRDGILEVVNEVEGELDQDLQQTSYQYYYDEQDEIDKLEEDRKLLAQNIIQIKAIVDEVIPLEEFVVEQPERKEQSWFRRENIDRFFEEWDNRGGDLEFQLRDLDEFLRNVSDENEATLIEDIKNSSEFKGRNIDEAQLKELAEERRKEMLDYFLSKLDGLPISIEYSFFDNINGGLLDAYTDDGTKRVRRNFSEDEDQEHSRVTEAKVLWDARLRAIRAFNPNISWKFIYYQRTIDSLEGQGFGFNEMTMNNLAYFIRPILEDVNNAKHARFFDLKPVALLDQRVQEYLSGIESLSDLKDRISSPNFSGVKSFVVPQYGEGAYSDKPINLAFGEIIRNRFELLIAQDLSIEDYDSLQTLVSELYPTSPQKKEYLRKLNNRIFTSKEIPIERKVDILDKDFSIEGTLLLAENINSLQDYLKLRALIQNKYNSALEGDESVTALAYGDFVTSLLKGKQYELLVDTVDSENSESTSTNLARQWDNTYRRFYDRERGLFNVPASARPGFISFNDGINFLKNLSEEQRFAIVHKAMVEQKGLLSSNQEREKLYERLIKTLDIEDEYLRSVFEAVIVHEEEDLTIVALIASKLLGPRLFESLSPQAVDPKAVNNLYYQNIYERETKDLIDFGRNFDNYGNQRLYLLAQESNDSFFRVTERLSDLLGNSSSRRAEATVDMRISPRASAIIEGMKGLGSPAVKGMQIGAIAYPDFSDPIREALFETFDANKGMNKLKLWENIALRIEKDSDLAELFEEVVEIQEYLGGGSLFTTYRLLMKNGRKAVIKILNSNAEKFIADRYRLENSVVSELSTHPDPKVRSQAAFTAMCANIANTWCLREINDPTYETDDDNARSNVIQRFNQKKGRQILRAPERIFTSTKIKVEEEFEGITLKAFLQRNDVSEERKAQALETVAEFFNFQLDNPTTIDGEVRYIVFSDPSVGNVMINPDAAELELGLIDRNLYISLTKKQAEAFRNFRDGNYIRFANAFVDEVLDANKIRGFADRLGIKTEAAQLLGQEFLAQKNSGRQNSFTYIEKITDLFSRKGLTIPLEFSLMIINIDRLKKVQNRK